MGGARYRSAENEGFVDTVFLGAFRRRVFETVGLYDPGAFTNEDAELNQRILEAGGKVYLSRDIVVHYFPAGPSPPSLRQYFRYGLGTGPDAAEARAAAAPCAPRIPFLMLVFGLLLSSVPVAPAPGPVGLGRLPRARRAGGVRVGRRAGARRVPPWP